MEGREKNIIKTKMQRWNENGEMMANEY